MSFYIGREASKLWKRVCAETTTEISLLAENWKYILGGLIFQYIHGLAARGVHYIHRPGPTLQDTGFFVLPELGQDKAYISETVFTFIFLSFVLVKLFLPSFFTVDIIVAWHTVNLVVFFVDKKLPEIEDSHKRQDHGRRGSNTTAEECSNAIGIEFEQKPSSVLGKISRLKPVKSEILN